MTDLLTAVVPNLRGASMFKSFLSVLLTAGPFIFMLGIIGFVIYLLVTYMDEIISGHVSSTYGSISNSLIVIFLAQIYVLYTAITSESFITTKKVNKLSSMVLYLLNIIGVVCTIILITVLKYYTTDG
jgi:preprotein translocase subunit Sss1